MEAIGVLMTCPMLPYLEQELDRRFKLFRLWNFPAKKEFLRKNSLSIQAVVGNASVGADADLIDSLPGLEIVANFSVGLDNVDLGKCREKAIRVSNTPDVLTEDVADLAIGLILATLRRICESDRYVRTGMWMANNFKLASKSLAVNNIYVGTGSDFTGVPTKMLSTNGSLRISVYNPATFFGIHVSSTPINLVYSEITVATGQLKKYYQPRKSHRVVSVNLEGTKVPLYGAGSSLLAATNNSIQVPLTLQFEIRSRGNVVGKLVTTKHRIRVSCPLVIDSMSTKPMKFNKDSCLYG